MYRLDWKKFFEAFSICKNLYTDLDIVTSDVFLLRDKWEWWEVGSVWCMELI